MRFGCCLNMISTLPDGIGAEWAGGLKKCGYDYVELPLAQIMELDDTAFAKLKGNILASGLSCEACNNFFPAAIRLTGDRTDPPAIRKYLEASLGRAEQLRAKTVVFGSAGAKNVPEGFPVKKAWRQMVELLRIIDEEAGRRDLIVAIEPLSRIESNIVNTLEEGLELAADVGRDRIQVLADYYHLSMEAEHPDSLLKAAGHLRHVHFANPEGRVFPTRRDEADYALFFHKLKQAGYDGRISVEAYSKNIIGDARKALEVLKSFDRDRY